MWREPVSDQVIYEQFCPFLSGPDGKVPCMGAKCPSAYSRVLMSRTTWYCERIDGLLAADPNDCPGRWKAGQDVGNFLNGTIPDRMSHAGAGEPVSGDRNEYVPDEVKQAGAGEQVSGDEPVPDEVNQVVAGEIWLSDGNPGIPAGTGGEDHV